MRHVAETTGQPLEDLYQSVAWPLYKMFGHAFEGFKLMVSDDGGAVFKRLEDAAGAPLEVLTPEVGPRGARVVAAAGSGGGGCEGAAGGAATRGCCAAVCG